MLKVLLILVLSLGSVGSIGSISWAENIKIGLPSVTITAMPFFVARDHGFFQQEGFNAEMVVMPASLNIKVLLAGDIQYAATIGSAVAAAIRGINVRVVMLFVDRPLQDLVGAPGINS
ncbi:MAG TPA: ABC transporter substrate-binding protein, partial [Candidatus Eisenbacteria bacterium]|nr:ABC transporter substrate-binding protein [Candidatus Eisenbacteria bacterium]